MKTYKQFQENVASLVLRKGSKFLLPALMTGIGAAGTLYQATKGDGESNFEKLRKMREKGEGADLEKKVSKKIRKRDIFKKVIDDYKTGLSAGKDVESTSSTGRINIIQQELEKRAKEGDKNAIDQLKKFGKRFKENMKRNRNMPNDK